MIIEMNSQNSDWKQGIPKGLLIIGANGMLGKVVDTFNTPTPPIQDMDHPRSGMGYEYYDWLCPNCHKFVAYEPNIQGIPKRCQECGQALAKPDIR